MGLHHRTCNILVILAIYDPASLSCGSIIWWERKRFLSAHTLYGETQYLLFVSFCRGGSGSFVAAIFVAEKGDLGHSVVVELKPRAKPN